MGARNLSAALTLALAAGPLWAQSVPARLPEQAEHLRAVRAEREQRVLTLYVQASESMRLAAAAHLEAYRSKNAPLNAWPSFEALQSVERLLSGAPAVAHAGLARAAAAIDLQLLPGWGLARSSGASPLAVRVYPLFNALLPGAVELELSWVADDGSRELARLEQLEPSGWLVPGFEVYVDAPKAAGHYTLEPALRWGGERAAGSAVDFCVLPAALDRGVLQAAAPRARVELTRALQLQELRGLREASGSLPEALVSWPPRRAQGGELLAPLDLSQAGGQHAALQAWSALVPGLENQPPRRVLVLLHPAGESARALLRQPWADASRPGWRALAQSAGAELVALDAAVAEAKQLDEGCALLRQRWPAAELVLVGRGEGATLLASAWLLGERPAVDALVLAVDSHAMGSPAPQIDTLIVAPAATRAGLRLEPDQRVEHLDGGPSSFLGEPSLPALLEAWFTERERARQR